MMIPEDRKHYDDLGYKKISSCGGVAGLRGSF